MSVDGCELILASLLIVLCEWILVTFNILQVDSKELMISLRADAAPGCW